MRALGIRLLILLFVTLDLIDLALLLHAHQIHGRRALPLLAPVPSRVGLIDAAVGRMVAAALVAHYLALLDPHRDLFGIKMAVLGRGAAAWRIAPIDLVFSVVLTVQVMAGVGPPELPRQLRRFQEGAA